MSQNSVIEQPRFSCALGAQQTVLAIKRAVPIIHSGPGCSRHVYRLLQRGQGYVGGNSIPGTNANESDVVFGGEKKLDKIVENTLKVIDGDLFVILTGCTADIVGDDVESVAAKYAALGRNVIYLETGGFKSNNFISHSKVINAIINQYVDKNRKKDGIVKGLVNVFAAVPYQDIFWNGNLIEIKRILEGIGLKVNILFGPKSAGIEEWKTIPNAEFNILINSWVGLEVVENLKKKYNTPYFHFPYLPIGAIETSKFLREVGEFAHIDKEKVEDFIKKEEESYYEYFDDAAEFILEFRYGLPGRFYSLVDSAYSIGLNRFLINELGLLPATQFVIEDTPEKYKDKVLEEYKKVSDKREIKVEFTIDGGAAQEAIRFEQQNSKKRYEVYTFDTDTSEDKHYNRAYILGSAWEKGLAKELNCDFITIAPPSTYRLALATAYVGYRGGLRIAEDIYNTELERYE